MSTDVEAGALRHVAFLYDDVDAAIEHVAAMIERDRTTDTAVLVSLPEPVAAAVARRVRGDDAVSFLPTADRYARPVDAMHLLWRFTRDALDGGARRVHSIGEIGFDGSAADDDWHWYERAVNEVMAELPLTATCLFDSSALPAVTIACVHATHPDVIGANGPPADGSAIDSRVPAAGVMEPRAVAPPERTPDLVLVGLATPAPARRAVRELGAGLEAGVLDRAQLVVSELVTNAILHGGGRADLRCWRAPNGVVVEVGDDGPGIDDPFAALRPPDLPRRGAGLWTAHLESSRLHIGRRPTSGTVVTARID